MPDISTWLLAATMLIAAAVAAYHGTRRPLALRRIPLPTTRPLPRRPR
ncbi:MAG: hypothetical protein K0Q71_5079 [Thermomicrobiales bacterium]|nr:hypothetical protein [Thermomicrobiales bacterium]